MSVEHDKVRRIVPPAAAGPHHHQQRRETGRPTPPQRIIVYPNYINSKKTVAEGRRIPAGLGACSIASGCPRRNTSCVAAGAGRPGHAR
jgi:hypothetical protein